MNDTHKQKVGVVVAARPGVMQESLNAILADLPWLKVLAFAGNRALVLPVVQEQQPALLLLDSDLLGDDILDLVRQAKNALPAIRCLVLTQTTRQKNQALSIGADAVFPRNGSAKTLNNTLAQLCQ